MRYPSAVSIFERAYDKFGVKAAPRTATRVIREPFTQGSGVAAGTFSPTSTERHLKAYGGGKDGVDWFYDAANIVARAVSTAPVYFLDPQGVEYVLERHPDTPSEVKDAPDDLKQLFAWPNPWMDWQEHVELAIIDLLAVGEYMWLKWDNGPTDGRARALYRMAPPLVELVPGKNKLVDHYRYGDLKLTPEQVVHGRLPNPHSDNNLRGSGIIQAAPQAFDIELGLLGAMRSFFNKGAVLAGALESDKNIPEPNRKRISREFRALHQGSENWHKVAFLEKGLRYRPIQANAQEAGYEALSKLSRDRVFSLVGVPRILAGIDDGNMKLQEAKRAFADDLVHLLGNPEAKVPGRLATRWSRDITDAWGLDMRFRFGYQMPEEDRISVASQFSTLPGITVKEARAKAGLNPLGPDFADADGVLIDDMVINMPLPSTESPNGAPGPPTAAGGAPANPANIPAFPNAGNRDGTNVNGNPPSAADNSRRRQTGVVRPRKPAVKASGGLTPAELASGAGVFRLPVGSTVDSA